MTLRTELWPIATTQYGFVTTQDARELGFSAVELAKLAPREKLERVSHGFYRFPELPHTERDDYMRAVLATGAPDAILSHDTALLVHDLCDINPNTIHVNVGNTRVRRNIAGVQLHGEIPDHGRIRPHNAVVVRHDRSARAGVLPRLVCPAQGPVEHRALASDGRRSGDHSR